VCSEGWIGDVTTESISGGDFTSGGDFLVIRVDRQTYAVNICLSNLQSVSE